jgi:hypothetical protein
VTPAALRAFDVLAADPAALTGEDVAALTTIGFGAEARDAQQRAQLAVILDAITTVAAGDPITAVVVVRIERR